jgi:Flp pilus assembly pilin Flp
MDAVKRYLHDRSRAVEFGLMGATIAIAMTSTVENIAMTVKLTLTLMQGQ